MTREELIAHLLDMAESYKAMRGSCDTGEELHYLDYEACIQAAEMLAEDSKKSATSGAGGQGCDTTCRT